MHAPSTPVTYHTPLRSVVHNVYWPRHLPSPALQLSAYRESGITKATWETNMIPISITLSWGEGLSRVGRKSEAASARRKLAPWDQLKGRDARNVLTASNLRRCQRKWRGRAA